MARQRRLYVPQATYFVVNRFRDGPDVLAPNPAEPHGRDALRRIEANRERFEALLGYLCRRWCAHVLAYCWLPKAALLAVRIGVPPLERVMHTLRGLYSQHLRESGALEGPAFASRYTALMIDPDDYLLDVARHIFWSPVHAGLSRAPLGYEWSSVRTCIGEPDPASLCASTLRDALALRGQHSRHGFERFLTETPTPGFLRLLAHGSRLDHRIAGSSLFVRDARRSAARPRLRASQDASISWVASRLAMDPADITDRRYQQRSVMGRALVAWIVTCAGTASLTRAARWFGCDPSTLHRAVDRYSAAHPELFNERTVAEFIEAISSGGRSGGVAAESDRPPEGEGEGD